MKGKGDFSSSKKGWSWGKRRKTGFMGFLWRDLEEKRRSEKGTIAAKTVQDAICIGMDITITCLSAESDHLWICSFFSLILGCIDIFPLLSSQIHSWIWCLVIKYIYIFFFFFYACLTCSKPVDSKYETWLFLVSFLFYFILFFLFFLLLLWYSVFGYHSLFPMFAYEILLRTVGVGDSNWEGWDRKKMRGFYASSSAETGDNPHLLPRFLPRGLGQFSQVICAAPPVEIRERCDKFRDYLLRTHVGRRFVLANEYGYGWFESHFW